MRIGSEHFSIKGSSRASGFFLVCLFFVVLAVAMNYWMRPSDKKDVPGDCIANLDVIKRAKAAWALENMKLSTDTPDTSDLFGEDKFYQAMPLCPQGGFYTVGRVEALPKCSFAGHSL